MKTMLFIFLAFGLVLANEPLERLLKEARSEELAVPNLRGKEMLGAELIKTEFNRDLLIKVDHRVVSKAAATKNLSSLAKTLYEVAETENIIPDGQLRFVAEAFHAFDDDHNRVWDLEEFTNWYEATMHLKAGWRNMSSGAETVTYDVMKQFLTKQFAEDKSGMLQALAMHDLGVHMWDEYTLKRIVGLVLDSFPSFPLSYEQYVASITTEAFKTMQGGMSDDGYISVLEAADFMFGKSTHLAAKVERTMSIVKGSEYDTVGELDLAFEEQRRRRLETKAGGRRRATYDDECNELDALECAAAGLADFTPVGAASAVATCISTLIDAFICARDDGGPINCILGAIPAAGTYKCVNDCVAGWSSAQKTICNWEGTAPFCGSAKETCPDGQTVRDRSQCGDGSACLTGEKKLCCSIVDIYDLLDYVDIRDTFRNSETGKVVEVCNSRCMSDYWNRAYPNFEGKCSDCVSNKGVCSKHYCDSYKHYDCRSCLMLDGASHLNTCPDKCWESDYGRNKCPGCVFKHYNGSWDCGDVTRDSNGKLTGLYCTGNSSVNCSECNEDYATGKLGKKDCPHGYHRITDETECRIAADSIGGVWTTDKRGGQSSSKRCYFCSYCNRADDGYGAIQFDDDYGSGARWICKKE